MKNISLHSMVPRSANFNTHKIATTAMLSKIAYQSPDVVKSQWRRYHDTKPMIPYIEISEEILLHEFMQFVTDEPMYIHPTTPCEDTDVYVFHHPSTVYICFRGSSSFKDFTANIDVQRFCLFNNCSVPVPKDVTIHEGFFEQFRAVESSLYALLETMLPSSPSHICVCGHSLGSALAQITAVHLASHPSFSKHDISCYSFGGPRVGNKAFADWFNSCVHENYRIVHQNDPIPNIPILPFWRHTGGLCIYFDDKGNLYLQPMDKRWYQRLFWFIKTLLPWSIQNIQKHEMDMYVDHWMKLYFQSPQDGS